MEHASQIAEANINSEPQHLYNRMNGECFYPLHSWPLATQLIFWNHEVTDLQTFKLILFFLGNGCSPFLIFTYLILGFRRNPTKYNKRICQIKWIARNLESHRNRWFYFDIHYNNLKYLNLHPNELKNVFLFFYFFIFEITSSRGENSCLYKI